MIGIFSTIFNDTKGYPVFGSIYKMKKTFSVLQAALLVGAAVVTPLLMTSCSGEDSILKNATEITLNGATAECSAESVYINEDNKITITKAGKYNITGTLDDGQIYVDCVDAGQLDIILNNANITNNDGSCIVIKNATDAYITLYEDTVNTLTDGSGYTFEKPGDDEPDAVVFCKEDLTINGTGKLVVNGNYAGGIYSKDGLSIDEGEFEITTVSHGIKGKDYLKINGGTFNIHAIGDGIKSNNTESELVGYVEINGGDINIYSEDEAVQAVSKVSVNGGTLTVNSINNGIKCAGEIAFNGGTVTIDVQDNSLDAALVTRNEACTVTIDGAPYVG